MVGRSVASIRATTTATIFTQEEKDSTTHLPVGASGWVEYEEALEYQKGLESC
jgi:hypothetical protein